jgi:hypothetical protein
VHEAWKNLEDNLVKFGVWIEVTDPNHPWRDYVKVTAVRNPSVRPCP